MKYIRIENGVYELIDDKYIIKNNKLYEKEYFNNPFGDGCDEYIGKVLIGEILAEADTPDELCDMFIYCKNGFYEIYRKLDDKHYDKEYLKNGGTIKGAIWTDKGLIYVAKLNEKGDLELI